MSEIDGLVRRLAAEIVSLPGVVGVVLSGSRALGTHSPNSDFDVGVYASNVNDLDEAEAILQRLDAQRRDRSFTADAASSSGKVGDVEIDLFLRDTSVVQQAWDDCLAGRVVVERSVGRPIGLWSHCHVAELFEATILAENGRSLSEMKEQAREYPTALSVALAQYIGDARTAVRRAETAIGRRDSFFVVGCLGQAVGIVVHVLHGFDQRWLASQKGAVLATSKLESSPRDFLSRVESGLKSATESSSLDVACLAISELVEEVAEIVR